MSAVDGGGAAAASAFIVESALPAPSPADDDSAAQLLLRAFDDEKDADTDFNAEYQEVFARVIQTPADVEERLQDLDNVIAAFVKHAQVRAG